MNQKVALVTGASRGIGRAIAVDLAKAGYHVVINYRTNQIQAEAVKEACETYGVKARCIQADVSNEHEVNDMIKQVLNEFNQIDVLVNNSGITKDNLMLRMSHDDFQSVLAVNLVGSFNCAKAVVKPMMKQRSGVIVNVSSVIGLVGNIGQANYAASKAGLIGFSKSLAKELAARNIRVNVVAPGFIQSEMTQVLSDDQVNRIIQEIPLRTLGEARDVSQLVVFLVSDNAKYITGQTIQVDGGMVI